MRPRYLLLWLCALSALLFAAGCGRYESSGFTAEIDEPGYRRGKDLLRQGRNQEALASFLKMVEKRGDDAPESHLELGILYQQHFKDPIAAIYHYRKFRELRRNSPQSDLVRQRIDAATREFARTLPAQPLENQLNRLDLIEKLDQLNRENLQLKEQLAAARLQSINSTARPPSGGTAPTAQPELLAPLAIDPMESPIYAAPEPAPAPAAAQPAAQPTRPTATAPVQQPAGAYRRHVVVRGDTLMSLSQRYYGTRSRWRDIYAANRNVMPNESSLSIGMELRIPQ